MYNKQYITLEIVIIFIENAYVETVKMVTESMSQAVREANVKMKYNIQACISDNTYTFIFF